MLTASFVRVLWRFRARLLAQIRKKNTKYVQVWSIMKAGLQQHIKAVLFRYIFEKPIMMFKKERPIRKFWIES